MSICSSSAPTAQCRHYRARQWVTLSIVSKDKLIPSVTSPPRHKQHGTLSFRRSCWPRSTGRRLHDSALFTKSSPGSRSTWKIWSCTTRYALLVLCVAPQGLIGSLQHFIRAIRNANPPIIPADRVEPFLALVASETLQLLDHNRALLENLRIRQREQHPIVQGVGDLLLQAALEWGPVYVKVMSDSVMAEAEVNDEKLVNPALSELVAVRIMISPQLPWLDAFSGRCTGPASQNDTEV